MRTQLKTTLLIRGIAILCAIYCIVARVALWAAEPPKAAWQVEWEKTVKAAEQEGQLTLYSNEGIEGSLKDFQSKFPKVKVVLVSGRAGQLVTRLMAERRADKHLGDLSKLGIGPLSGAAVRATAVRLQFHIARGDGQI
jgi:hypothetical protein